MAIDIVDVRNYLISVRAINILNNQDDNLKLLAKVIKRMHGILRFKTAKQLANMTHTQNSVIMFT